jgi:hypothetical protein
MKLLLYFFALFPFIISLWFRYAPSKAVPLPNALWSEPMRCENNSEIAVVQLFHIMKLIGRHSEVCRGWTAQSTYELNFMYE